MPISYGLRISKDKTTYAYDIHHFMQLWFSNVGLVLTHLTLWGQNEVTDTNQPTFKVHLLVKNIYLFLVYDFYCILFKKKSIDQKPSLAQRTEFVAKQMISHHRDQGWHKSPMHICFFRPQRVTRGQIRSQVQCVEYPYILHVALINQDFQCQHLAKDLW